MNDSSFEKKQFYKNNQREKRVIRDRYNSHLSKNGFKYLF